MRLNYRQQITFIGMLVGAMIGAVAALVWLDRLSGREIPATKATTLGFGDAARIATATISLVRQVYEMTKEADEAA
jgi:gas vesicle protein